MLLVGSEKSNAAGNVAAPVNVGAEEPLPPPLTPVVMAAAAANAGGVAVAAVDAAGCGGSVVSTWAKGGLIQHWGL